jgi:hypothetical protein
LTAAIEPVTPSATETPSSIARAFVTPGLIARRS